MPWFGDSWASSMIALVDRLYGQATAGCWIHTAFTEINKLNYPETVHSLRCQVYRMTQKNEGSEDLRKACTTATPNETPSEP